MVGEWAGHGVGIFDIVQKFPSADKFYQGCYGQGKVRVK